MCVPVNYFRRMRRRLYKQVLFLDVGRNFLHLRTGVGGVWFVLHDEYSRKLDRI